VEGRNSAIEALLLWALQEEEKQKAGTLVAAVAPLLGAKTLAKHPGSEPEAWALHEYVEVAAHLKLIEHDTAKLVRLAKGFRNLIHPGSRCSPRPEVRPRYGARCARSRGGRGS
jgi:hypothetical protein